MPWHSPPTRREVSLVLFSLTTFVLFYNLRVSLTRTTSQAINKGANASSVNWDEVIYGNWTWEEQQVAENAQRHSHDEEYSAVSFHAHIFGSVGVNDGILDWGDEIPTTTVLKHVPGHTIMDNVFMLNGTLFVVTDDSSFPPLGSIASSRENSHVVPRPSDWQILSSTQARETLGPFGGLIHGVSWLVTDASPSNYTLFALWRTYSALGTSLSPDTLSLPPPRRVLFPNVTSFMGERPGRSDPIVPRQRSPSGFHPLLAKAAFPTLGLMYAEDLADYALLHVPFLMKRVVVADQGAARRARADVPPFAVPLVELKGSRGWWEPIRRNVARFLDVAEDAQRNGWLSKPKMVVTYLSRQDVVGGPKLRSADHEALVQALGELVESAYEVHVVSSEASWVERMRAIAQSTVVVGVYGDHMADCVYVPPSVRATVMEIFPPGVFLRDVAMSVGALDVQYVAWWEARQHGADALPPVVPPGEGSEEVPIDVGALVQAIRRIA